MASSLGDRTDVETSDQAVFDAKNMVYHLVGQQLAREVAHGLMDPHDGFCAGVRRESHRLDMRVDHRPLAGPVATNFEVSLHVATVLAVRPQDVCVQESQDAFNV